MEKLRAASVDPSITPKIGNANKLYFMFYFWGYTSAFLVYITLSHFFPVPETHVPATIHGDIDFISAAEDESRNSELGEENKGRGVVVQTFAV